MESQRPPENRPVTIYDIAREAGVSAATVSRVLTNNANVRSEKKKKVLEIMEKHHFKPNALARGLVNTRRKVIGIIAADVRNPFYADLYVACEIAAKKAGYTAFLCNLLPDREEESRLLTMLQEQQVDAVIQFGGRVDDMVSNREYVRQVNRVTETIPMVITGKLDGSSCYMVQIDARRAMELLMRHLTGLGHDRIAVVGGLRDVLSTNEKIQEYRKLLEEYGIPYREEYIVEGTYDQKSGYACMERLLALQEPPTAVIAINDFSAAGVLRCLQDRNIRIPEDISVVSHDDTYIAEFAIPSLTSICYNYENMGRCVVETAIAAIEQKEVPRLRYLEPTLVVRESSGRVRESPCFLEGRAFRRDR